MSEPKVWRPATEFPNCCCGDRIVIVVSECPRHSTKFEERLVVLESTEDGWDSDSNTYAGYGVEDGERWAYERDIITGDPADRKRIAELEGAAQLALNELNWLVNTGKLKGYEMTRERLRKALQSTEVRDGE